MKIIQILPTIAFGDAVGNDTVAIYKLLKESGYQTGIFAENIDPRLSRQEGIAYLHKMPKLQEEDILIYHLATGSPLNYSLHQYPGRKVIIYHNITPPEYFLGYHLTSFQGCKEGLAGAVYLAKTADYVLADSAFNRQCLLDMGYECDIDILPILIPMEDYQKEPNAKVIQQYSGDGYTNILFTGRVAPNKKHEDIIKAFAYYKKYYNKKSRLFLVGNTDGVSVYYKNLKQYITQLEVEDVIFPGHIGFDEILAYYHVADVFLCQSEHEGFCVPLVEAMCFDVPIIAYESTAIGETLGGSGVLMKTKNPLETAGMVHRVATDQNLRNQIIRNQKIRLQDFQYDKIAALFWQYLNRFIGVDQT